MPQTLTLYEAPNLKLCAIHNQSPLGIADRRCVKICKIALKLLLHNVLGDQLKS